MTRFSATATRPLLRSNKRDLIRAKIAEPANESLTLGADAKRLQGRPEYRVRVQDWRVIFRREDVSSGSMTSPHAATFTGEEMTVQFLEIAGQKMAVLPVGHYERLIDAAEDRSDAAAAMAAAERPQAGEAYLPGDAVDRLVGGESALRVWRKHRGLTQAQLGDLAECRQDAVARLETGGNRGSTRLWQRLATALDVALDDIVPVDRR